MLKFLVTRPKDTVLVFLMKNKLENTYSYVNVTKEHICPCKFPTVEAAIQDMEKQKEEGKILSYEQMP